MEIFGNRWRKLDYVMTCHQGAMYRVEDIAGKITTPCILKHHIVREDERYRFVMEARALSCVNHPNIVRMVDHSPLDDLHDIPDQRYTVLEWIDGTPLNAPEYLFANKGSVEATLCIGIDLAQALIYLHAQNIVHRDIKPWNVMQRYRDGQAVLLDFGSCMFRIEDEGGCKVEIAPPRYTALDVYGAGKLLFFLLAGKQIDRDLEVDSDFSRSFITGEKTRAVHKLLERTVCPLKSRIQKAEDLLEELLKLASLYQAAA